MDISADQKLHPCGDYPAPCNCDDPTTHDGAIEVGAADNSANSWRSALEAPDGTPPDESELVWYSAQSPSYSSDPTPAQIEAARRFVSRWLEGDNHGFIIPGSEWGLSLKHWLHTLVARPAPGAELIVDPPYSYLSPTEDSRSLVEQVRSREYSPSHWISDILYEPHTLGDRSEDEIEDALSEARRMRREDEDQTRSMLGRTI